MRKIQFQTGEYYHIYNRGVDKREVFMDEKDFTRFLRSIKEFNNIEPTGSLYKLDLHKPLRGQRGLLEAEEAEQIVELIAYSLLPNHFHFIIKQLIDGGITKFMNKLGNGYTQYFNFKYDRNGSLFQGPFKAIHITTDEHLVYLSGYINGNAEIHKIFKAENWPWSSYKDFLGIRKGKLCQKKVILNQFKNIIEYQDLANIIIKESRQRKAEIKKYLLE